MPSYAPVRLGGCAYALGTWAPGLLIWPGGCATALGAGAGEFDAALASPGGCSGARWRRCRRHLWSSVGWRSCRCSEPRRYYSWSCTSVLPIAGRQERTGIYVSWKPWLPWRHRGSSSVHPEGLRSSTGIFRAPLPTCETQATIIHFMFREQS